MPNRLLCISYRFPPETYPLAIRVKYFLDHLRQHGWTIDAITAAPDAKSWDGVTAHHISTWKPTRLLQSIRRLRLGPLLNWLVWPDEFLFWVVPAYLKAYHLLQKNEYDAIVVFMMPYSQGLIGLALKQQTGLPLILNLNDSITCSDMNSSHPSRLHYRLAHKLEDAYVWVSDAVIYVSERNMNRVRGRQPVNQREKFHLIRRGVTPLPSVSRDENRAEFNLVYTGGTGGWYQFLQAEQTPSTAKKLYHRLSNIGRFKVTELNHRTHGPIFVGQALKTVLKRRPKWEGRLYIDVFGGRYPQNVEQAVLSKFGLTDVVRLHDAVPHTEALKRMVSADLLFMALPDRPDGSPGGRISAKTYEYLMTDRPILAALPAGENREYLADKPGVTLVQPSDVAAMADAIEQQAAAYFAGNATDVDRSALHPQLLSTARAEAFENVLLEAIRA